MFRTLRETAFKEVYLRHGARQVRPKDVKELKCDRSTGSHRRMHSAAAVSSQGTFREGGEESTGGPKADYPNGLPQCGSDDLAWTPRPYRVMGRQSGHPARARLSQILQQAMEHFKFASMLGVDASKGLKFPDIEVSVLSLQLSERPLDSEQAGAPAEVVNAAMTAYFGMLHCHLQLLHHELLGLRRLVTTSPQHDRGRWRTLCCYCVHVHFLEMGLRLFTQSCHTSQRSFGAASAPRGRC